MKHAKRIITILIITILSISAVFISYIGIENGAVVYATNEDGTLTNDELDVALSSWLQSHGGNIWSPQNYRARKTYEAGLLHNFIYDTDGGYDAIRSHINGGVGGNNELKFDFDGLIIQQLNTWLNNKLQNGEFGQGVELNENDMFENGINNNLYNGKFVTIHGNTALVYIFNGANSTEIQMNDVLSIGSAYTYTREEMKSQELANPSQIITFNYYYSDSKNTNCYGRYYNNGYMLSYSNSQLTPSYQNKLLEYNGFYGELSVIKSTNANYYFIGNALKNTNNNTYKFIHFHDVEFDDEEPQDTNIFFITNNNNNVSVYPNIVDADGHLYITPKVNVGVDGEINYQPYIVNEGDTINNVINQYYIDSNTPDKTISYPTDNPNDTGGGGGSSDNPIGGNPPDWSNNFPHLTPDGEGGFNFNFTLPDLNIDWNISGLTEKFPFSIPFDFVAFCRVLDAEPETPALQCDIDLKIVTWHVDYDLHQFDDIASLLRNLEFIAFCIALVIMTRNMIKG